MCNRVNPDFVEWAKRLNDREDATEALQQAFEQGYSAGYHDASEHAWEQALEEDAEWLEAHAVNLVDLEDRYVSPEIERLASLVEGVKFDLVKKIEDQEEGSD